MVIAVLCAGVAPSSTHQVAQISYAPSVTGLPSLDPLNKRIGELSAQSSAADQVIRVSLTLPNLRMVTEIPSGLMGGNTADSRPPTNRQSRFPCFLG
jgi:hypothetical protein